MNDVESIVTEINSCISLAAKRQHGLIKMSSFLENCSTIQQRALLENYCTFWIKTLFQIFENHPVSLHAKLAHYCYYLIIQNSKNLSNDLCRTISTNYIEKSINLFIGSNEILLKNSLICLNELMLCYRPACTQFKVKIEAFIFNKLDSNSDEVMEWASKCYSKLPFLHKNVNTTEVWYSYFKCMINCSNAILNELFDEYQAPLLVETLDNDLDVSMNDSMRSNISKPQHGSTSVSQYQKKSDKIFAKIDKDVENLEYYFKKNFKRFKTCCQCMTYLFEPLNEQIQVKAKMNEIVQFLKRIFTFDVEKLLSNCTRMKIQESIYLSEIFGDILNEAMKFSVKCFSILSTNFLVHANTISHFLGGFSNNLKETIFFNSTSLYFDCVSEWIKTNGPSCGFYQYSTSFIKLLLEYITPSAKKLIIMKDHHSKSKSNKSQSQDSQNFDNFLFDENLTLNNYQLLLRSKIVISALNCLKIFIKNFNNKLPFVQIKEIQESIIETLLLVQYNSAARKPYDQVDCRLCLYENLLELCLTHNQNLSPPLSQSINVFKAAMDDSSNQIKMFSHQSLTILKSFTYPILPIVYKQYNITTTDENNKASSIVNATTSSQQLYLFNSVTNNTSAVCENDVTQLIDNLTNPTNLISTNKPNEVIFNQNKSSYSSTNNILNSNANSLNINSKISNPNEAGNLNGYGTQTAIRSGKLPPQNTNNLQSPNENSHSLNLKRKFNNDKSNTSDKAKNFKLDNNSNNINRSKINSLITNPNNEDSNGNEEDEDYDDVELYDDDDDDVEQDEEDEDDEDDIDEDDELDEVDDDLDEDEVESKTKFIQAKVAQVNNEDDDIIVENDDDDDDDDEDDGDEEMDDDDQYDEKDSDESDNEEVLDDEEEKIIENDTSIKQVQFNKYQEQTKEPLNSASNETPCFNMNQNEINVNLIEQIANSDKIDKKSLQKIINEVDKIKCEKQNDEEDDDGVEEDDEQNENEEEEEKINQNKSNELNQTNNKSLNNETIEYENAPVDNNNITYTKCNETSFQSNNVQQSDQEITMQEKNENNSDLVNEKEVDAENKQPTDQLKAFENSLPDNPNVTLQMELLLEATTNETNSTIIQNDISDYAMNKTVLSLNEQTVASNETNEEHFSKVMEQQVISDKKDLIDDDNKLQEMCASFNPIEKKEIASEEIVE